MTYIDDPEGAMVPAGLPPVIDAHVHIFPDTVFAAIRKWFDAHAWHIRYQMTSPLAIDFLLSRGVRHIIALQYAHKPGIAGQLNQYMAETCRRFEGRVTGMATVFPGEDHDEEILQEAFDAGLDGLKLHAHVQCFDINGNAMNRLYDCCRRNKKPIVMHAGREPKSDAYPCDPYQVCAVERIELVLKDFPDLKICVPHLGFDETAAYAELIEKYDNLWLDTTMVLADYFPMDKQVRLDRYRPDRIMYGSDFPNIPYAWDRELKALQAAGLSPDTMGNISSRNAAGFFGIDQAGLNF
ncbi:MAG: amidohydrolase family protein [Thermodesulfobacteriota bacterium]